MKQGKPLQRKTELKRGNTPLKQGKPLQRKTELKRTPFKSSGSSFQNKGSSFSKSSFEKDEEKNTQKPLKRTALKAKRPAMTPEERSTRIIVEARSGGICEMCGRSRATDKAHRVSRTTGPWSPENILDGCRGCHSYNHAHPNEAYEKGQHLQSYREPLDEPVWFHHDGKFGWAMLSADGSFTWCDE